MSGFENLNVNTLYEVLADILSKKHDVQVKFTVRKKEEAHK